MTIRPLLLTLTMLILPLSPATGQDMQEVSEAYERGDYATVIELIRPLAEQGDAEVQSLLGLMYYEGKGVLQDHEEAALWLSRAAVKGRDVAQSSLGRMYYHGEGVPQDHAEATRWYRKAAEQGDAEAQLSLGLMHYHGEGVPQDHAEAARWLRKAAEQGYARAQAYLGDVYFRGEGVPQDYVLAYAWLNLAEMSGDDEVDRTKKIQRLMTAEQIARAREMSTNLFNWINSAPTE